MDSSYLGRNCPKNPSPSFQIQQLKRIPLDYRRPIVSPSITPKLPWNSYCSHYKLESPSFQRHKALFVHMLNPLQKQNKTLDCHQFSKDIFLPNSRTINVSNACLLNLVIIYSGVRKSFGNCFLRHFRIVCRCSRFGELR